MTPPLFPTLVNLAAGALLLTAVLIVWRRQLRAAVILLALQGAALAVLPLAEGIGRGDAELIVVGVAILLIRALVLPTVLARLIPTGSAGRRESAQLTGTSGSLLIVGALIIIALVVTRPIVQLQPGVGSNAVPASFALVLIAVFVMASRRQAVSQAIGFLMMDNGITATALLLTGGVPLVVELGASLDVLLVVLVLGLLATRMRYAFGSTDLGHLQELRD